MIERILLADSGTGHSEEMLKALMAIPAVSSASVTLLHVVPQQATEAAMTEKLAEGERLVAAAAAALSGSPGLSHITPLLRTGEPKDVVCQVAEELDASLIIMGSRGLKRLVSILENSVSQYVFQLSSRPMLLVKDDVYVRPVQRVLVTLDKTSSSQKCLDIALFLLRDIPNCQLTLLHCDPNAKADAAGATADRDPLLAEALIQAKRYNLNTRCFVTQGKAGEAICRMAEETKADLLILGSPDRRPSIAKGLPDLDRLLGTSVSDYVRVYANCPVLMARSAG
jgi:nucleotide-binding universal stress UspA family protein